MYIDCYLVEINKDTIFTYAAATSLRASGDTAAKRTAHVTRAYFRMRLCLPPAYLKHYWNIGKNQNISVSGCLNLKTQVSKAELISNTPYTNKAFNFVSVDFCTTHLQLCTKGENNARSEKFARA